MRPTGSSGHGGPRHRHPERFFGEPGKERSVSVAITAMSWTRVRPRRGRRRGDITQSTPPAVTTYSISAVDHDRSRQVRRAACQNLRTLEDQQAARRFAGARSVAREAHPRGRRPGRLAAHARVSDRDLSWPPAPTVAQRTVCVGEPTEEVGVLADSVCFTDSNSNLTPSSSRLQPSARVKSKPWPSGPRPEQCRR
jgi:hypothetical protein